MQAKTKFWSLIVSVIAACLAFGTYDADAQKTNSSPDKQSAPLFLLRASGQQDAPASQIGSIAVAPAAKGGQLYTLRKGTKDLTLIGKDGAGRRPLAAHLPDAQRVTVGPQGSVYVASNSELAVVDADGQTVGRFALPAMTTSVAGLTNGEIVAAAAGADTLLEVFDASGRPLRRFGRVKELDRYDPAQNRFLNAGLVATGPSGEVYHVSMFSPAPAVQKFAEGGALLAEFPITGAAVDLQLEWTREYLSGREFGCTGGYSVVTAATVDPATGHLWLAANGSTGPARSLSRESGVLMEYSPRGDKLAEYALAVTSPDGASNIVTNPAGVAVSGSRLHVLTSHGQVLNFDLSQREPARLGEVSGANKPKTETFAARFVRAAWSPLARPVSAAPQTNSCPEPQTLPCATNCPDGSTPPSVDCGAALMDGESARLISGMCTITSQGTNTAGGCSVSGTFCNTADGSRHTKSLSRSCNAAPLPTPTPTPVPTPTPISETGEPCAEDCRVYGPSWVCNEGICTNASPVLIDVAGDGFALTDAAGGVRFALRTGRALFQLSWTVAGDDDAWLALDRNGNGTIDSAEELFGNFTPQPASAARHGFIALAEYDKPANGGNADGVIDGRDAIFASLRLWQDVNHNGLSEPQELHALAALDVARLHLDYKESKRTDAYGNQFRYRAKVDDARGAKVNRWAWDVFLVSAN